MAAWRFLLPALLLAACQEAPPPPETPQPAVRISGWVTDEANLLSAEDEELLADAARLVERERGHQFVIVTVPSLRGRPILDFSVDLARAAGIGRAGHNDGLVLLVAPSEKLARIEVGYGLERRVTDPYAARVMNEEMLPRFRRNDFPGGIKAGSAALIARLRSPQTDAAIAAADGIVQ